MTGTHLLRADDFTFVAVDGEVQPHPVPKSWLGTTLLPEGAVAAAAPVLVDEAAKLRAEIEAQVRAEIAAAAVPADESPADEPKTRKS